MISAALRGGLPDVNSSSSRQASTASHALMTHIFSSDDGPRDLML